MSKLLIALSLLTACESSYEMREPDPEAKLLQRVRSERPIAITYYELIRAYEGNEVSADATYKGKAVRVPGKVVRVTKDDGRQIVWIGGPTVSGHVICVLPKAPLDPGEIAAVDLTIDMGVEAHGIGGGTHNGSPILVACVVQR